MENLSGDPGALLFAYGSLMLATGIPEVDAAMRDAGLSLGRGFVPGRLFDLGAYPGAVPAHAGAPGALPHSDPAGASDADVHEDATKVWGRLIRLRDPAAFFGVIDAYEGFTPADRAASEFVRAETRAYLPDRRQWVPCQIYWFNQATEGRRSIEGGDYLAHWHAKGRPAQGRSDP